MHLLQRIREYTLFDFIGNLIGVLLGLAVVCALQCLGWWPR